METRTFDVVVSASDDEDARLVDLSNEQGAASFPSAKDRHCRPCRVPVWSSLQPTTPKSANNFNLPCFSTPTVLGCLNCDVTLAFRRTRLKKACLPGRPRAVLQFPAMPRTPISFVQLCHLQLVLFQCSPSGAVSASLLTRPASPLTSV